MLKGCKFLLEYCWKYNKKYIVYAVLYQVLYATVPLASVILPKLIIDELTGQKQISMLVLYTILLIMINFVGGICLTCFCGKMFTEKNHVFTQFQCMMAEKLAAADLEQLEDPKFLDIKERAHQFLYANGQGFGVVLDSALNIFGKIFVFIGLFTIISTLNIFIVILFAALVLLNAAVEAKVKKKYVLWDMEKAPIERKTSYLLNMIEDPGFGKEIRLNDLKDWLIIKMRDHYVNSADFYDRQMRTLNISQYFSVFTTLFREGVSYGYLIYSVIFRNLSIGDFSMYVSALAQFGTAMNDVMQSIINLKQFGAYYDALEKYLNIPDTMRQGKGERVPDKITELEFRNVSFCYGGQEKYALKNISLKLKPGEKVAVVGENGAGKTTFVKLLSRMYDSTEGEILLNGVNIKDLDYEQYHRAIAAVFQDYKLFSFTLQENIAFENQKRYSQEKLMDILEFSGFPARSGKLKNGLDTYINRNFEEDGFVPSGGEGQKIAIARALYKDAPIVILDEPTAALDPRAEYEIYQKFDQMTDGKMALFITHRLSSVHFCSRILVFKDGELIGDGTHSKLMQENEEYAQLYHMQAQLYEENV